MIFCKINFQDEKFILVATELAAESKAKKKFWHYFATGGQSNSVWNFFHLYCNSIRPRFQTILMMKDSKMYFLKVKSALKFRLNRSFWRGGIWKIGVDFHRGVVSPYLKPNLCYLSRVTFLVIRPPFVRAQLYIPMSRAAFWPTKTLSHEPSCKRAGICWDRPQSLSWLSSGISQQIWIGCCGRYFPDFLSLDFSSKFCSQFKMNWQPELFLWAVYTAGDVLRFSAADVRLCVWEH